MGKSAWPLTKSIFAVTIGTVIATAAMFASVYIRKSIMTADFVPPEVFMNESLNFAIAIAVVVFLSLSLIGLPVQAVMQKERVTGYIWHVLPALIFGAVLYSGAMSLIDAFRTSVETNDIIRGAGLGFISSSIAWLIRRPDLDKGPKVTFVAKVPKGMAHRAARP